MNRTALLLLCACCFATPAAADPIEVANRPNAPAPAAEGPPAPKRAAFGFTWTAALAGLFVLAGAGMLVWSFEKACRRFLRRDRERRAARFKARRMLYPDLSVEEAQRIVWAWEEMTDEERAALPLAKRVEFRQIRSDLETHRNRWGDLKKGPDPSFDGN